MAPQPDDRLLPCNWHDLNDKLAIWHAYQTDLRHRGYHIMGSELYKTLGEGDDYTPPPPSDPFHPTNEENFVHHLNPCGLYFSRNFSCWQPGVDICFGIDRHRRQVVLKAVPTESPELKALHLFSGPSLRADKRNRVIPVLDFVETAHDFVIIIMPAWGLCWQSPPCGSMTTRGELAMKLTETLQFLHANGVAHGDIHPLNIVINHLDSRNFSESNENDFRLSSNIEYAYIDFGSAHTFTPGVSSCGSPRTIPPEGISSPEQKAAADEENLDINLFAADVYNLGKTLEQELCAAFEAYGERHIPDPREYKKILWDMTSEPSRRPTATEVVGSLSALFQQHT
ncbi:hypothetical protein B0H17DRAFT_1201982 [Mycena rosella]|uniref:Protein kinase domain-containing protein n=1 Tax=Mycena rosella TaxID=1033263 RepID=A0AAD7DGV9_MYCRO|nr:hypothetical protein B0H17DRAFT_1201982 [Mycena rosella]